MTVLPTNGAFFSSLTAIIFNAPSSKSWVFVKAESLNINLISSAARFSGDISSSIPMELKSISLQSFINSTFDILAIVLFAPSCLERIHVVKFVFS